MEDMLVEICVDSLKSAIAAVAGGADRIELCSALELGGLTPSAGLLKAVKSICNSIPVYCMIRCRAGDFFYNDLEIKTMLDDIELLKQNGADGFVFGALTLDCAIDAAQCCAIVSAASPLPVTFHRAFDYCKNWHAAADGIIDAGFKWILTSGQKQTAVEGAEMLKALKEYTKTRKIAIIAGILIGILNYAVCSRSGITSKTLPKLLTEVGPLDAIHSSASVSRTNTGIYNQDRALILGECDNNSQKETVAYLVAELKKIVQDNTQNI